MRCIWLVLMIALAVASGKAEEEILIPGMLEVSMPSSGKRQPERQRAKAQTAARSESTSAVPTWSDEAAAHGGANEITPAPMAPAARPRRNAAELPDDLDTGEEQEIIPFPAAETMSSPEEARPMAPATASGATPRAEAHLMKPAVEKKADGYPDSETAADRPAQPLAPRPAVAARKTPEVWEEPVARLDGESVSRAEFYRALIEAHGKEVLERFLNRLLLKGELKRRGLTVTEAENERVFQEHLRRFAGESGEDPAAILLRETGMSAAEYKANVVWLEVAVRKLLKERLAISEADVFNYYWMSRSQYSEPEMVRARHILVNPAKYAPSQDGMSAVGQAEWAKALEKALEIQNRLRGGMDFAEAARRFSHDNQTAGRGGDLGFFPRHAMVKPFSDAAFALKDGQVSEPVKTVYGYHLIKVEERRAERLIPFDQIQERVRRDYEDYLVMAQAADLLALLRQEAAASGRLQIIDAALSAAAR